MAAAVRPHVVAFDMIETVFALDGVGAALERVGSSADRLDLFFSRLLRDAFALTAAGGDYRPFADVADATLATVEPALSQDQRQEVLAAFRRLDPHPDVEPALDRLAEAGVPAIALTNGSAEVTDALLERAGLRHLVGRVIGVEEVGTWKPNAAPYLHAASVSGVDPGRLALVAMHPWDIHGATRAGLVAGWVDRDGGPFPEVFDGPAVSGRDLVAVVERLLALP